jgi:hypothetical protein
MRDGMLLAPQQIFPALVTENGQDRSPPVKEKCRSGMPQRNRGDLCGNQHSSMPLLDAHDMYKFPRRVCLEESPDFLGQVGTRLGKGRTGPHMSVILESCPLSCDCVLLP